MGLEKQPPSATHEPDVTVKKGGGEGGDGEAGGSGGGDGGNGGTSERHVHVYAAYTYLCLQPVGGSEPVPAHVERVGERVAGRTCSAQHPRIQRRMYDWASWVRAHDVHTAGSEWVDSARQPTGSDR